MMKKRPAPWPLIEIAIEPKSKADREKLSLALSELADEDPSFRVSADHESGQTILKGTSELHLDIKVETLKRTYKVDVNIGAPQVSYRETITRKAEIDYTLKGQTGGIAQFARVKLVVQPSETGKGFAFEPKITSGAVPKDYILAVERGLRSVISSGVLSGFPVMDVEVQLIDGAFHEVEASAMAFEIAARAALREGLQRGGSILLEPIMKVEVSTPEGYIASVIGDLNSRRGQIQGQDTRGNAVVINALVPLGSMFGLLDTLRAHSEGQATFTATYAHYSPVSQPDDPEPPPAMSAALRA